MRQVILAVSFGTTVPQARESITRVERTLAEAAPGMEQRRAFTSATIRRVLAKRGEIVLSLEEALEQLAAERVDEVVIQPTHLLYGIEYDRIRETAASFRGRFFRLKLGRPLLADHRDLLALAASVVRTHLPEEGALVLLGHGTEHFANMVYPAFQTALRMMGVENAYVGTVEGWPAFEDVLKQLQGTSRRQVRLVPLMLVAGDHVRSDMAGQEPESWKSRLESAGYAVECRMEGLGQLKGAHELYRAHLQDLLEE